MSRRHHSHPQLEAEIARDPEADAPYLVYADWLQGQGDLRGELIVTQHALGQSPRSKPLRERESALLGREARHFYGDLAGVDDSVLRVRWKNGFIATAQIAGDSRDEKRRSHVVLERLLPHPSARFLQHLQIQPAAGDDHRAATAVLRSARRPPTTLRTLCFGDGRQRQPATASLGGLDWEFFHRFPSLERLTVQGVPESLGVIELPRLIELALRGAELSAACLTSVAAAAWPHLERLELWLRRGAGLAQLRPLLAAGATPRLRHLALHDAAFLDQLCDVLPSLPVLAQLETLDLSGFPLHAGAGTRRLIQRQAAFQHLRKLHLSGEGLDDETRYALTNLCPDVVLDQRQYYDLD